MARFDAVRSLLDEAVATRACPAIAIEVGHASEPLWRDAAGTLTYEAGAPPARPETVFDLASLTKIMATATLLARAVDAQQIALEDQVARWLPRWRGQDRETVTVRDLLSHSAGLTAYLPLYRNCSGRVEFEQTIADLPLEYAPRTRAVYSDLGFILLGFVLEEIWEQPLPEIFGAVSALVFPEPLAFNPPVILRDRTAPTEIDPWRGRLLVAEVHDENAWALGGAAGHAGLFGTAAAVGAFARLVLRTLESDTSLGRRATLRTFMQKSEVPGSSRALGWDTMLPTSSCGRRMTAQAVGHTGFTGTSLWIDPARHLYTVLLANRVHPTRTNEAFKAFRPRIHDAVMLALGF